MGIFEKFKSGFKKSASAFTTGLRDIVVKKEIDDKTLDKIEDYLIQSDVGIVSASEIREIISQTKIDPNKDLTEEINNILKNYIISIMKPLENIEFFKKKEKLNATLISGVNGVGKTTTIGKLGKYFKDNNRSVVFGAADTFRAAAIDQLQVWAAKVRADIIKSEINSDPASVAYKTAEFAKKNQIDIALIDTAGRLQNKKNLMEEYKKIINVLKKVDDKFPNEVVLVLDATTGQNALNQVDEFSKIHNITGLIITKLDSTAKGGIILAICKKYNLPIVAVGMGEKDTDLHPFKAEFFAKALLGFNS